MDATDRASVEGARDVSVAGLLDRVRRQADQVQRIQQTVEAMQVTGSSPNNEVTVRLAGTGRFTEILIDPETLRRSGPSELSDLVLAAVNDGLRKLDEASSARFAPVLAVASEAVSIAD
ncbi:MAG TPA: YbaB/EbfC family nucleoid-associated protein [Pseudonocardiaceae bacterium]|jgi:hypothetical protein|nr:YbaB/EbfC family nucleoid-associated protein [Pseudonocardiaceae bacterium]